MQDNRPNFLGIGAAKSGTTWLWAQLKKHPDIWLSPAKEIHFFDRSTAYPSPNRLATKSLKRRLLGAEDWERPEVIRGTTAVIYNVLRGRFKRSAWWWHWTYGNYDAAWYVNLFRQARPGQICGEITPAYAILEIEDIEAIRDINPEMKFIFIIRDPIERAWSGIRFSAARENYEINLDSLGKIRRRLMTPLMILRGDYERTLENYLRVFESSQVLVCFYDAISRNPNELAECITKFLGVSAFGPSTVDAATPINISPKHDMPGLIREHLIAQYGDMISRLSSRFGSYASEWEDRYDLAQMGKSNRAPAARVPALHP